MTKYIKCPRCDLNYIDPDKQEYCDVCLAEMQGAKLKFADLDEEEDMEKTEICPVCGVNYMRFGEKMCDECKKNSEYEEDADIDPDKDEEWRNYLDEDTDMLDEEEPPIDIGEDFDGEFEDDFDEEEEYEDTASADDDGDIALDDLGDYDDEDEEEDDEEDEDDDF